MVYGLKTSALITEMIRKLETAQRRIRDNSVENDENGKKENKADKW